MSEAEPSRRSPSPRIHVPPSAKPCCFFGSSSLFVTGATMSLEKSTPPCSEPRPPPNVHASEKTTLRAVQSFSFAHDTSMDGRFDPIFRPQARPTDLRRSLYEASGMLPPAIVWPEADVVTSTDG